MSKLSLSAFMLFLACQLSAQSTWSADKAHAKIGFTVTHLLVSEVDGTFKTFDAKITAAKDDLSDAVFEATIDANSATTDNEMRDGHLKKPDMFDTEKFPTLTFKSTSISKAGDNRYTLKGNLTMKGVTKEVSLDMLVMGFTTNRQGKKVAGVKITGAVKRTDFGVGAMPSGVVAEDVVLRAVGEFVKG